VSEEEMMVRRRRLANVVESGRVAAGAVAEPRRAPRFVERDPSFDVIAKGTRDDIDVLRETFGGVAHAPSTSVLKGLGKVPVVEGDRRLDVALEESFDEATIEVESSLIR
jgi:hypothetical protein